MQITIQRENFLKPLSYVAGVVERRQTLPILANTLLRQKEGVLTLTGTDLEVEVVVSVNVDAAGSGELTLPARKLLDICRALPAQARIEIKQDGEKAVVQSGKSRFTLLTLPVSDFPNIETAQWDLSFSVPQKGLKALLDQTQFCMAQQDVRYYLNGLLLELADKRLRAVATDGHRMALSDAHLERAASAEEKQVIVPRKGVHELSRFLEDSDTTVEIQVSPNHLRVRLPDLTFTSKLIDGRFPDYNKVIPAAVGKRVRLERERFRETLSRVAILSNEKYRGVRFSVAENLLTVSAHNPEQEEAQEELAVQYSGEPLEIGFNVNYVMDAVSVLSSAEIELGMNDANSSCVLYSPDDTNARYVIMPMRL